MRKLLLIALLPLFLRGASLSPIGADLLTNGSGGVLLDGTWYSREAAPLDDGRVLFIGRNCQTGYTDYTATLIADGDKIGIVRQGALNSYIGLQPNDNWSVFALGRKELYGTISFFNENAFLYISDNSAGVFAFMVEGLPLQGNLQSEEELAVTRVAASGNGKVVVVQVSGHEMNVFKRGDDEKWICTAKDADDFTAELYRGIALNFDGMRMWHFTRQGQNSWLAFTDTASDGTETTVAVMQVDDGTQHAYYVACADNGNIVYFTSCLNGVMMLMKGVYDDGSLKVQVVSVGTDGLPADGDCRSVACSADGRFAVFASKATNLTKDAVDGEHWQIFVYDSLRNELKLMSTKKGAASNADCETPAISANGRNVTFTSAATNLGIPSSTAPHLYKAECENVDATQGVVASDTKFERVAVSDDGGKVMFSTTAVLDVNDNNTLNNVYERDTAAGVTFAVSPLDAADYRQCAISGDGKTAVYIPYTGDETVWPGLSDYSDICSLSLDFDGDVLAYIDMNGRLMRQQRGQAAVVLATDATDTTGASSAVRLSHDGEVLIYTCRFASGKTGLKAWFAETGAFITLTENSVQYVHLSQSGRYAFYRKSDYKLYRQLTNGGVAEVVVDAGDIFAVSRDGRYAFHDTRTSTALVRQELFGNHTETAVGDSDGLRYSTIGVSTDGSVVYYVSSGSLVYDTLPVADEGTFTVITSCETDVLENTGDDPAYEIVLESSGNADYALRLIGETTAKGGTVSLLYPNGTRSWYGLNYIPELYFCGTDSVVVEYWNGREWIAATVQITVENVNNPPEWTTDTIVLEATENEVSGFLNLLDSLVDHDLDYSAVTNDKVNVNIHGPETTKLLRFTEDGLQADLTGRYDLVQRGGGSLEYTVTATDEAGEQAVTILHLNITNTDLPPVLSKISQTAYEGLLIEWSWFDVSDPDAEDTEDNLRLCFQSRHAEFYDKGGNKLNVADGVYKSQFPITYRSTCNIQLDNVSVWAKDLDGLTSDPMTLVVEAAYIEVSLVDYYGEYDDEGHFSWKGIRTGWNLLSVPCDIPEENMAAYKAMMGLDVIWRWNGKRFAEATSLNSDEGFWGYVTTLPDVPRGTLAGRRVFTPLRKGWNLRGAYGASQGKLLWMFEKKRQRSIYVRKSEPVQGLGHWIFVK
ncbi:MAG: hypothetical protein IKZ46_16545 [Victivallales bacterium]|nr:hypothetical protein [Victivallales bacterium]